MKQQLITLCIAISLLSANLNASTLVVAKTGGTYTTIQAGISAANAGDTVVVKAGTYNEAVSFNKSGTANGYITLKGESGAIIDGTGKGETGIYISNKNYIRVIGLEIQNVKGSNTPIGISVEGNSSNLEIRNNLVHNIENPNGNAHGIAFYGTSATPIDSIIVDGNEIRNCKLGQSESMVLNGNVTNFTVSNNVVHDNDNIGIDFIGFEGTAPTAQDQVRNGICFGNRVYNISSSANPTYGGERSADGIYVDGGKDIIIERNFVDKCDIGVEIASEHGGKTTSGITVRSNFISRSFQGNIMAGGYAANKGNAANITIVNNTMYQGGNGEVILQFNCTGIIIKNNICYANSGNVYLSNSGSNNMNITVDNNLYYGASTSSSGPWTDAHAEFSNPQFTDAPIDLHISANSPAKNSGMPLTADMAGTLDIDGQPRILESSIDIGADEIGASKARDLDSKPAWLETISAVSKYQSTLIYGLVPGLPTHILIFSSSGKCLRTLLHNNSNGTIKIDNAGIPAGRYLIKVSNRRQIYTGMILITDKR